MTEDKRRRYALALGYKVGTALYYNPGGDYEAPAVLRPDGQPVQLYSSVGLRTLTLEEQWQAVYKALRLS